MVIPGAAKTIMGKLREHGEEAGPIAGRLYVPAVLLSAALDPVGAVKEVGKDVKDAYNHVTGKDR